MKLFFWMKLFFDCDQQQAQAHKLSVDYMSAFLDKYLKEENPSLLFASQQEGAVLTAHKCGILSKE